MIVLAALALLSACRAQNDIVCSGMNRCTCPPDATCSFDTVSCGPTSCSLECGARALCEGRCTSSCSIDCQMDAVCNVGVGESGSVTCAPGSNCNVTCAGSCSVSCGAGAQCNLRCATDPGAHTITTGSGSCT